MLTALMCTRTTIRERSRFHGRTTRNTPTRSNYAFRAGTRKGLLSEVTNVISAGKANILNAQVMTYPDRTATSIFEIEIVNASQLQKIVKSIQKIKEVRSVERMRSNA